MKKGDMPISVPMKNFRSYWRYWLKMYTKSVLNNLSMISTLLTFFGVINLVHPVISSKYYVGVLKGVIDFAPFVVAVILWILDYNRNLEDTYSTKKNVDGAYDEVVYSNSASPDNNDWVRCTLKTNENTTETVYYNSKINDWLMSEEPISIERDRNYEKKLRKKINSKWESLYMPFLKQNYRDAMYLGKLFYNERKFGISQELNPGDKKVKIHKTCYYDSYLTNIIPGSRLLRNNDLKVVADASEDDVMPYIFDDILNEKHLQKYEHFISANEPGVTTVCIQENGYIQLWTQNVKSMSNQGQIVATGSGSADWTDCRNNFKKPDGFRDTIIFGMEREAYEESNGNHDVSRETFMKDMETRITGYFRWLKKAGKAEFVGLSRINENYELSPDTSEVFQNKRPVLINAQTIDLLKKSIEKYIKKTDEYTYETSNVSVSCTMALLALHRECIRYCESCNKKGGQNCANCPENPYYVLFHE